MIDYTKVLQHAETLVNEYPDRFAGTENAARAASYIAGECRQHGIPCRIEEVDMYVSLPADSSLKVLSPEQLRLESVPFANTPSTEGDGLTAEVVFVGPGSESDFQKVDVSNKIVLAESSYTPPRQEKIRLAENHGALGILVMHWGDPDSPLMVRGNAKAVWGNPSIGSVEKLPHIPALGISRRDGSKLIEMIQQGPVSVVLTADSKQHWGKSQLPVIQIPGQEEPEKILVIGGHYDSWAGGATDNAVGDGLMLELARSLWERRAELKRSVWIAFWPGHETATMSGSSWFVDYFWDELAKGGIAYLNIDTLGLLGSSQFLAHCSAELSQFARAVSEQTLSEKVTIAPLARTGDQSFFGVGIPSIYGRTAYDESTLRRTHGATLGWWNHSHPSQDNMDKVDPQLVEKAGRVINQWVWELLNGRILPFNFKPVAQGIHARLEELLPNAPEGLKLDVLRRLAEEFREKAALLDALQTSPSDGISDANRLNDTYLRLCRILTPVLHSVAGRYGQDPYGLSALKTWLPGLYPLDHEYQYTSDMLLKGAIYTSLLRERNRARDALAAAIKEVDKLFQD